MSKLEIDMEKVKDSFKKSPEDSQTETKKLVVKKVHAFHINNRSVFAFLLLDDKKILYEFRMTTDLIYEDQIKKSFSRMKSVELLSEMVSKNPSEEKKDAPSPVEEIKS